MGVEGDCGEKTRRIIEAQEGAAAPASLEALAGSAPVRLDEEALLFFLELIRAESLPAAAERSGVSLSSANRMLAKLRRAWGEPLFVRSGASMVPTAGARARVEEVERIAGGFARLRAPAAPNPRAVRRVVRLAAYDNAFAIVIASRLDALMRRLPGVRFHVTQADESAVETLRADRLDLLFYARQGLDPSIRSMPLLTTPYVCVVRRGHPLEAVARRAGFLEREDLAPWRQVLVNAQPNRSRAPNSPANGWFNPPAASAAPVVTPFFLAAPVCVEHSDCCAVMPEAAARLVCDPARVAALPFGPGAPTLTMRLGWHERTDADPAFQLIRGVIADVARAGADGVVRQVR